MVKWELVKSLMDVRRISPGIFICGSGDFWKGGTIISVYLFHSGRSEEDKKKFRDDLSDQMQSKKEFTLYWEILMNMLEAWYINMKEFLEGMDREFEIRMVNDLWSL